ncbi:unnamed protein product [Rotaria sp. Silwood1]|nr:unnamed protein product [Rotaria sp. Silwood1]CAF4986133.1 unnamed protein product [Rotaria sp. Silwood1]
MGSCTSQPDSMIDEDLMNQINKAVAQSVATLPSTYTIERERIVGEMRKASPDSYENLYIKDYPDKNESSVNDLALKNVTKDEAKQGIANQINQQIQPKVDEKTNDMNPLTRQAFRKAVEKTIEKLVDKSVDAFIEKMKK